MGYALKSISDKKDDTMYSKIVLPVGIYVKN